MKKFQLTFYVLVLSLAFLSCKKTSQVEDEYFALPQKSSIQNYLTSQKTNNSTKRIKQIEKLSENLLLDKSWVEKSNAHSLIITPINELYQFSNNKGNKVSNYFVCVMDSTLKIVTSYIVQNKPLNSNIKTDIKKGAIANMDDNNPVAEDCNVRFINMYDYYLYEENYKNNTLVSTRSLSKKPATNDNSSGLTAPTNCTAWYWVTTYSDGSQTWEYLYTTCSGDESIDPEDGGSGGGGGEDLGSTVTRDVSFVVKEITTGSQARWKITGKFRISGVVFTNTANNFFTSIAWVGALCDNYNAAYDGLPYMLPYFVFSTTHVQNLIGPTVAKGTVNAFMYYPNLTPPETHLYPKDGFWHASTDLY